MEYALGAERILPGIDYVYEKTAIGAESGFPQRGLPG